MIVSEIKGKVFLASLSIVTNILYIYLRNDKTYQLAIETSANPLPVWSLINVPSHLNGDINGLLRRMVPNRNKSTL